MLQDLLLWTHLTPPVGATPGVQVHIGRAHHSAPVFISPATTPASLLLKNLPAFDNKHASKLATGRVSSEMFEKNCLPEIRSCNYISVKDENLRPKSNKFQWKSFGQ